jgi:hypothetical protein
VASSDIPPSRTSSSPFKADEQHLQTQIHWLFITNLKKEPSVQQ